MTKHQMIPENKKFQTFTCLPLNQALWDSVVFNPSSLANPDTKDLVPVNGMTESWSPLQGKNKILIMVQM